MPLKDGHVLAHDAEMLVGTRNAAWIATLNSWDAVIEVARIAGAITPAKATDLRRIDGSTSFSRFVARGDRRVTQAAQLLEVPPGAFIAFISVKQDDFYKFVNQRVGRRQLVHAMISLGQGRAAGINNLSGIGIGSDGRWEVLDLTTDLNWIDVNVSGVPLATRTSRELRIRYRKIERYQTDGGAGAGLAIGDLSLELLKRVAIVPMNGVAQAAQPWSLVTVPDAQHRRDLRLVKSPDLTRGGAWALTDAGAGATAPVCFLPWLSGHIVKLTIRNDDPPIFATAALTGCSIFTHGDDRAVTVWHAGIDGSVAEGALQVPAPTLVDELDQLVGANQALRAAMVAAAQNDPPAFWRLLHDALDPGLNRVAAQGWTEVNKTMYSNDGSGGTQRARNVAAALQAAHQNDGIVWQLNLDGSLGMPWGSYLGFRTNGQWAMYLQENLTLVYRNAATNQTRTTSFPIALVQVFPPGREGLNLISPVPGRLADPWGVSDTVV